MSDRVCTGTIVAIASSHLGLQARIKDDQVGPPRPRGIRRRRVHRDTFSNERVKDLTLLPASREDHNTQQIATLEGVLTGVFNALKDLGGSGELVHTFLTDTWPQVVPATVRERLGLKPEEPVTADLARVA
jgi:hypothetical protein